MGCVVCWCPVLLWCCVVVVWACSGAAPASPVAPSKQCFVVLFVKSKLGFVVVGVVVRVTAVVAHFVFLACDVVGFVLGLVGGPALLDVVVCFLPGAGVWPSSVVFSLLSVLVDVVKICLFSHFLLNFGLSDKLGYAIPHRDFVGTFLLEIL